MQAHVSWRDELRTMVNVVVYGDDWNWSDFDRIIYDAFLHVAHVNYGVIIALDLMAVPNIPPAGLAQIERLMKKAPRNHARLIIITDNDAIRFHFATAPGNRVMIVETLGDMFL